MNTPVQSDEKKPVNIVVKCQCDGYAFDLEAELHVDQIEGLMKKLHANTIAPAQSPYLWDDAKAAGAYSATNSAQGNQAASDAPLCPVHSVPMKPSTKGSGWFCSRKMPDGSYCSAKA